MFSSYWARRGSVSGWFDLLREPKQGIVYNVYVGMGDLEQNCGWRTVHGGGRRDMKFLRNTNRDL